MPLLSIVDVSLIRTSGELVHEDQRPQESRSPIDPGDRSLRRVIKFRKRRIDPQLNVPPRFRSEFHQWTILFPRQRCDDGAITAFSGNTAFRFYIKGWLQRMNALTLQQHSLSPGNCKIRTFCDFDEIDTMSTDFPEPFVH